jgi:hypothetical protein
MDELDQLVTSKQDVIYNFFNWPSLSKSKLIVIAVANTHDLPERVMSGKVRSRLGESLRYFNLISLLIVPGDSQAWSELTFTPTILASYRKLSTHD